MSIVELLLIGIGLSMDACAVSMTNGMCYKPKFRQTFLIALSFGLFQALMPFIGYYAGSLFAEQISSFDHWIALILLGFIGGKMIVESRNDSEHLNPSSRRSVSGETLWPMASADAGCCYKH